MATVSLEDLTKEYGTLTAVNDLDLEIEDGELLCLLGPSGCGKSTTLRMLGGLETPTSGDVHIGGERATETPPYERDTSMVFQSWALFPSKTVLTNVAFGPKMTGIAEEERTEQARRVLEVVEMSDFAEQKPPALSGGQKQRVALARSLAVEPEVLLLDEPLSNLDKRLREQMQLELRSIQEEVATTFVHVTHDQNEAFTLADRIAVLNDGRLEQIGTPREVYSDPHNLFVEEFLGDTNLFAARVEESDSEGIVAEAEFGSRLSLPVESDRLSAGEELTISLRPEVLDVRRRAATDGAVPTRAEGTGATEDTEENERVDGNGAGDGTGARGEETSALHGTITDVLYRGASVRYYVSLSEGELFFERSVGEETDFEASDDVRVGWNPSDLLVFADGERVGEGDR
ncbi:ABC transporter ATP-binding protein [Halobacteriales archaeon QS_3_64_16]|nr:MAG: ABC transporter ATP-binding protein [Halobacteriales archaeon QS_3_64_16]